MQNNSFYALVFRQKYIKRWGLMRNTLPENLSEHAMETAVLAHALALIGNEYFQKSYNPDRIATLALFHDVPEVYTGDLPTPVKYFDRNTRDSYQNIEDQAIASLLGKLPAPLRATYSDLFAGGSETEHRLVKAADKLCAYIKCLEEKRAGNREFDYAAENVRRSLDEIGIPEVHDFLRDFLPAFEMTLDELNHPTNE